MLQYFFTYGTDLPPDVGFPMFGAAHICCLIGCSLLAAAIIACYKKSTAGCRRKLDKAAAWFLIFLMAFRYIYLAIAGALSVYELPLHLCSMAGFLCLLHAYKDWDWLGQVLYALCLPGTVAALVFPDWTYYPPVHCITIEGFLFHFGVAVYVIFQLFSRRIRPQKRGTAKVMLFLLILVPPIYIFDKHYHTNYFFVNVPSPGSPLELFAKLFDVPGYLAAYAALVLIIVFLFEAVGEKALRRDAGY